MKTPRTIQTKRTRPKAGFRMLHAATRLTKKRKQRASTAAHPEDLGEVPGVGVARALLVIFLLHAAAIAGICLHNRWSEGADIKASVPALKGPKPPSRIAELRPYTVNVGDNYDKIARKYGVDREALEKVNEGKALEAGWVINLPNRRTEEISPVESMSGHVNPPTLAEEQEPEYALVERPPIQTSDSETYPGSRPGEMVELEGAPPEQTSQAILIKPRVNNPPSRRQPRIRLPQSQPAPASSAGRHTVSSGDTLYGIARRYGVNVTALQRANPNVNASSMRIGTSLVIPGNR